VYVDSTEGMLPHFRSRGDQMDEEERLLYVALSRARDRLHVSYALSGDNEQEEGGLSSFLGGLLGEAISHS
jgi:superfamily I DNA/RNA helicase